MWSLLQRSTGLILILRDVPDARPLAAGKTPVAPASVPASPQSGTTTVATRKPVKTPDADAQAQRWRAQLAGEFQRVADVYEQASQYPPYSLPIDSKNIEQYQYNRYYPVTVPLQNEQGGKFTLHVILQQLHFQKGEPVRGRGLGVRPGQQ